MEKVEESLSPALVGILPQLVKTVSPVLMEVIPELVKTVRKYIDNRWFKITSLSKSVQDIDLANLSDKDIEKATLACLVKHQNETFRHEKELVIHILNEICGKGKTVSLLSDSERK